MSLIKSISGIRGTIGGKTGENLTPIDIVESAAAFGSLIKQNHPKPKIVIGRDARMSGKMVQNLCMHTLNALGIDVIDCQLSTTPTIEMAVVHHNAQGGIILTASHNPKEWNALKLLNEKGEFISAQKGEEMLGLIRGLAYDFVEVDDLGSIHQDNLAIHQHIEKILELDYIDQKAIQSKGFRVLVDCINSTGAISIVPLLEKLGCDVITINEEMTGDFAHTPEPLPKNLQSTFEAVKSSQVDLGIVVDPDVDRLAFIDEHGEFMGEEYTLVAVADYIMRKKSGPAVSNLSSSIALQDICEKHGVDYHSSAVGEVNVVEKMKEVNAVIGGEGNGGVILPDLHYGRDALAGTALFLNFMAETDKKASAIRAQYRTYFMVKDKMGIEGVDLPGLLKFIAEKHQHRRQDDIDGLKIYFDQGWVHLRKSNTEPIIRIYCESTTEDLANELIARIKEDIDKFNLS
jgi:phosphomannomutase